MSTRQRICWALSDGRKGMENQALGLAEAVAAGGGVDVELKRCGLQGLAAQLPEVLLASPLAAPLSHLARDADSLNPPWPDLLIGCGRVAVGLSMAIKRAAKSQGHKVVTVQTQNPRISPRHFDLVVPPVHDGLTGPNVMATLGAPGRVTPDRLAAEAANWRPLANNLPRPLVAVLIGGTSSAYEFTEGAARQLSKHLLALRDEQGCGLMITASRRTGPRLGRLLRESEHMRLLVFDPQTEEVVQWVP